MLSSSAIERNEQKEKGAGHAQEEEGQKRGRVTRRRDDERKPRRKKVIREDEGKGTHEMNR